MGRVSLPNSNMKTLLKVAVAKPDKKPVKEQAEKLGTAVIVGRFQTDERHAGHCDLLDQALANHTRCIVFLGSAGSSASKRNPLDFRTRQLMVNTAYPEVEVYPLQDQRDDGVWSAELDRQIRLLVHNGKVTLYGGRDSFANFYKGKFPVKTIEPTVYASATVIREAITDRQRASGDFRAGCIYTVLNQYDRVFPTVDGAVWRRKDGQVELLMCRKPGERGLRFFGGFVDPADESLEAAARRELHEELGGIEVSAPAYIGSFKVRDWRMAKERDGIMTTLFAMQYVYGPVTPGDDIESAEWVRLDDTGKRFVNTQCVEDCHAPLLSALLAKAPWGEGVLKTTVED